MFKYLFQIFISLVCTIFSAQLFAQSPLPRVHLVTHSSVEDREFIYELKCMLEKVFTVEIVLYDTHNLDISSAYRANRTQYYASELLNILSRTKATGELPDDGYIFYIIEPDMYDNSYNYLFGLMNFKTDINVISMARLRHQDDGHTTDRMFRLIAKNIAKFNGHRPSGKCFMGFSNSLGELDSRAVRLCEPDLGALQSMGLVRLEIKPNTVMKGCLLIS